MDQLKAWLDRPYPLLEQRSGKWAVVIGFAIFTYIFLLLYQPYGAAKIPGKSWYLAGFGGSVFLVMLGNYFLMPRLLPQLFVAENWQIRKEVLYIASTFLGIAIVNYLYNSTVGRDIAPPFSLLEFVGITISVGIFPLLGLLYFNERRLRNANQQLAKTLQAQSSPTSDSEEKWLIINSETSRDNELRLELEQFVYAVAENNYTTIHFQRNSEPGQQLLRLSLKALEEQLQTREDIIRCHRSYLINKRHIISVEGNARSLYLRLNHSERSIPVSRNLPRSALQ